MSALVALVPAGGSGSRLGAGTPKQFLAVAGRPVLEWALAALLDLDPRRLVVAVPADRWATLRAAYASEPRLAFVIGGESRQESVARCFEAAPGAPDDLILVHDAARPATAGADLAAVLAAARACGAAVLGRSLSDTLKRVVAGAIVETVERHGLFRAETPQVFRRSIFAAALARAANEGFVATDESALVERLDGVSIRAVEAAHPNPKLTQPSDLPLLAALLAARR